MEVEEVKKLNCRRCGIESDQDDGEEEKKEGRREEERQRSISIWSWIVNVKVILSAAA